VCALESCGSSHNGEPGTYSNVKRALFLQPRVIDRRSCPIPPLKIRGARGVMRKTILDKSSSYKNLEVKNEGNT
jgi:hypothetical protein